MNLFEFRLRPLTEVEPWGEEPDLSLHWYGLTDGFYHMNVGEEQLYRYSDELMDIWSKEHSYSKPFFDYQVTRLHEDVLCMLSDVLQPIPVRMHEYISTVEKQRVWEDTLAGVYDETEYEEVEETYEMASEWLFHRRLQGMGGGPNVIIWRVGDTIHIRWNSESILLEGVQAWSTARGEYQLTVEAYVAEVESFHHRLMNDMRERIRLITTNNPMPHVNIDIPALISVQEEKDRFLSESLNRKPNVDDWGDVLSANIALLNPKR
ncbi:hypothetical protein A9Q99_08755 [Gammaproteobacteria bacterium 45_16_T64]|nr:hypothetical protein A9Q99_08755 [Gammaproteobacteria bacterium 45_16_T64]